MKGSYGTLMHKMGGGSLPNSTNDVHNIVRAMLVRQGWTLTQVVKEMNRRHPERKATTVQNISNKLTRGTIKFSEVLEIMEIIELDVFRRGP